MIDLVDVGRSVLLQSSILLASWAKGLAVETFPGFMHPGSLQGWELAPCQLSLRSI